ncbi:hypothetical protein G6F17_011014 [Rhizopus arrhizus]|uniref:Uncharacterized protein n=1 Tax=Rhizopus delemar TaxID=936053 RepID=A0A9P6XLV0_9FUNG|nr:hypothetical protein G6F21_012086 [Rhizopus arrhizus]KAG1523707.1 hypothetical protein G6F50_018586 [Rhizopus delemar]KAG0836475.1 hypothetical protein G6F18_005331 [Rhizopus arrhizus]KAG0849159.1 hypothetical protein G6F17_011014 [Rhizopus arrhizus]KAG0892195.1 hypothetical protein G6F34_011059 [Rhizopus arrhizus]
MPATSFILFTVRGTWLHPSSHVSCPLSLSLDAWQKHVTRSMDPSKSLHADHARNPDLYLHWVRIKPCLSIAVLPHL